MIKTSRLLRAGKTSVGEKRVSNTKAQMKPRLIKGDLERADGRIVGIGRIEEDVVKVAYRRWAPIYDHTFGRVSTEGRKHAVEVINQSRDEGRVLEVGVGTGLALGGYARHLEIIGIDLSPDMLDKARDRVAAEGLDHVTGLHEMDAGDLQFPDNSFDIVTAMYVMTVVPEPEKVMRELARVCTTSARPKASAAGLNAAWHPSPKSSAGGRCLISPASWCAITSLFPNAARSARGASSR
jgi:SAM-dependent methyltransferase